VVSEVARRHEISPQLLSAWRKAARHGLLKPPDGTEAKRPAGTAAIQDWSLSSCEASSALGSPGPGHQSSRREAGQRLTSLVRTSVR
jgi:transposase-like protein